MTTRQDQIHRPAGDLGVDERVRASITPEDAGWTYSGLDIVALPSASQFAFDTNSDEAAIVPLRGSGRVTLDGFACMLEGRLDVFSSVTDFAYVPPGRRVLVETEFGGEFAVAKARTSDELQPAYGSTDVTQVTVRGAGACTRQVNNIITPDTFPASRLLVVEVLSPGGNWSSYPPHKHDEDRPPDEVELEEIYYFRTRKKNGFGIHRLYSDDGAIDITSTVGDGDVFLIPRGYHGPTIAGPGYDLYYLNVLAGPLKQRAITPHFDPTHYSIRDQWETEEPDPRVPFYD